MQVACKVQVTLVDINPVMVICSLIDSLVTKPDQIQCLEFWLNKN